MTTPGAAKQREPHRQRAKKRRHPKKPPVLAVARLTARKTIRTQNRVIVGLDGDYCLLQARQDLLRSVSPQLRDLVEATKWPDIPHIDDPCRTINPVFNQAPEPRHPRTPNHQPIGQLYRLRPHPPHSQHSPIRLRFSGLWAAAGGTALVRRQAQPNCGSKLSGFPRQRGSLFPGDAALPGRVFTASRSCLNEINPSGWLCPARKLITKRSKGWLANLLSCEEVICFYFTSHMHDPMDKDAYFCWRFQ
jgi:hypothetical protein